MKNFYFRKLCLMLTTAGALGFVPVAAAECVRPQVSGYETVDCLKNGMALAKQNGKWSLIDKNGKVVVQLKHVRDFPEGLVLVKAESMDAYAYIHQSGKLVVPLVDRYSIKPVSEGLALVKQKNGKWDFIDKTGKMVTRYDDIKDFSEGLMRVKQNGKWGFIDKKTGKVVIPIQYDDIKDFSEGLMRVKRNGKWGFIDKKTGKVVIPIQYDDIDIENFSEGLMGVKRNGKWGFIDKKTGKVVLPIQYDDIGIFSNGLAMVKQNGKLGFIDKTGKVVLPIQYDDIGIFSNGLAMVKQNGKYGYLNESGKVVIPIQYDDAHSFKNGRATVQQNGKEFEIDKKGRHISDTSPEPQKTKIKSLIYKLDKNGKVVRIEEYAE